MDRNAPENAGPRRSAYQNAALTAIAVLLGLGLVDRGADRLAPAGAVGAFPDEPPTEGSGLVSPAEQRKQMIAELKKLNARLEAIEARLKAGLSVKVTDMPAQKQPESKGEARADPAPGAAPK